MSLPKELEDVPFIVVLSGETYSTDIVYGSGLLAHLMEAVYGPDRDNWSEHESFWVAQLFEDHWRRDINFGCVEWETDVGETDSIRIFRLTHLLNAEDVKLIEEKAKR